jgi:hypothetical protein
MQKLMTEAYVKILRQLGVLVWALVLADDDDDDDDDDDYDDDDDDDDVTLLVML